MKNKIGDGNVIDGGLAGMAIRIKTTNMTYISEAFKKITRTQSK